MPVRALLLDAMGTLVALRDPAPELARRLRVAEPQAREALAAEIRFYRAEHLRGADSSSLALLRDDCAAVLRGALGTVRPLAEVREALLGSLRFEAWPEVPGALRRLRVAGLRLVAVSNWDVSLPEALGEAGVLELLDGVVASAAVGAAKPDPAPLRAALRLAGVDAGAALMVGDSVAEDLGAARAAAVGCVLLRRPGAAWPAPAEAVATVRSLDELAETLGA